MTEAPQSHFMPVRLTPDDENTYIYMFQCNLWKSNNASNELGLHLNQVMRQFTYKNQHEAGLYVSNRPVKEDNYKKRLESIGILTDGTDQVISRPNPREIKTFRSSYKKSQETRIFSLSNDLRY